MALDNKSTMPTLHHLDRKMDSVNDEINDFMHDQASGEATDPAAFMELMEKRSNMQRAMDAQFKLNEKPLKTVLNESH